jgi:hypothetical protein
MNNCGSHRKQAHGATGMAPGNYVPKIKETRDKLNAALKRMGLQTKWGGYTKKPKI